MSYNEILRIPGNSFSAADSALQMGKSRLKEDKLSVRYYLYTILGGVEKGQERLYLCYFMVVLV